MVQGIHAEALFAQPQCLVLRVDVHQFARQLLQDGQGYGLVVGETAGAAALGHCPPQDETVSLIGQVGFLQDFPYRGCQAEFGLHYAVFSFRTYHACICLRAQHQGKSTQKNGFAGSGLS